MKTQVSPRQPRNTVFRLYRLLCFALLFIPGLVTTAAATSPNGMVILHTDYGSDSVYVGMLKGAIYHRYPEARIDTFTNSIPPYDIALGAEMLAEGAAYYPKGTVFCCVVDPGVGTERRGIVLESESGHFFVAPDNGLLQGVIDRLGFVRAHAIENRALWRDGRESTTFHGRDIFGPISASLASGLPLEKVGEAVTRESLYAMELPTATVEHSIVHGQVLRVDDYGNVITNVPESLLEHLEIPLGESLFVTIGKHAFSIPFVRTYGEVPPGDRLACIQSFQLVELAVNLGHLADQIQARPHQTFTIRKEQDTLFDYRRHGGTLTNPERLVIHRDGSGFVIRDEEMRYIEVDAATLETLQDAAENVSWTLETPDPDAPAYLGADDLQIDLHYSGQNLRANGPPFPEALSELLDALNALITP